MKKCREAVINVTLCNESFQFQGNFTFRLWHKSTAMLDLNQQKSYCGYILFNI